VSKWLIKNGQKTQGTFDLKLTKQSRFWHKSPKNRRFYAKISLALVALKCDLSASAVGLGANRANSTLQPLLQHAKVGYGVEFAASSSAALRCTLLRKVGTLPPS